MIGGSSGSLDVILKFLPKLKAPLSFPIILVLHRKSMPDSVLADLFSYKTEIRVKEIEDKEPVTDDAIFIAPPDYHLLIEKGNLFSLDVSEKINYSRPSIDVTFESAAERYGSSLVCILLSGSSVDGVEGLRKVKSIGGMAVVQDPSTAESPYMPTQAISEGQADKIIKADDLADFINSLATDFTD